MAADGSSECGTTVLPEEGLGALLSFVLVKRSSSHPLLPLDNDGARAEGLIAVAILPPWPRQALKCASWRGPATVGSGGRPTVDEGDSGEGGRQQEQGRGQRDLGA